MSATGIAAWALALLLLPVLLVLNLTESRHTKIRRWRRQGLTWQTIASRLGTSPTSAKRWAAG